MMPVSSSVEAGSLRAVRFLGIVGQDPRLCIPPRELYRAQLTGSRDSLARAETPSVAP